MTFVKHSDVNQYNDYQCNHLIYHQMTTFANSQKTQISTTVARVLFVFHRILGEFL